MRRSLRKLIDEFPPPDAPMENEGDWEDKEAKLGLALPDDYKEFIKFYGSSYLNSFMYVLNPFSKNKSCNLLHVYLVLLGSQWERESDVTNAEFEQQLFPFAFYPATGGLLPWGITEGGDEFYWRTKGKPNQWDVVIHDRGSIRWLLIENEKFSDVLYAMLTDKLEEFWLQNDTPEGEPRCVPFD